MEAAFARPRSETPWPAERLGIARAIRCRSDPMSLDLDRKFPRRLLAFWPSPIHPLARLSAELGVEVWAKRDDIASGLAFGGNKIRKLEWLGGGVLAGGGGQLGSHGENPV